MIATNDVPAINAPCSCTGDRDVDRLRDLVTAGWDQADASRLLWGDQTRVSRGLAVHAAAVEARAIVRTTLAARHTWLHLPNTTGTTLTSQENR